MPIRFLNPSQMFKFTAQYYLRRIDDIWKGWEYHNKRLTSTEGSVDNLNHVTAFLLSTNYWNSRLLPQVAWSHDWTNDAWIVKPQLTYVHSSHWSFIMGATLIHGGKAGKSYEAFDNKDYFWLKAQYKWY